MTDQLFKPSEIQKVFRVSRATLDNWISSGKLQTIRIGGTRRVRKADLDAFMDAHLGADAKGLATAVPEKR